MSGGSRWLYSDDQLAPDVGVQFELRYVGSIPVRVSIKSVDLETRTKIAHAAINRVCEDVGLKLSSTRLSDKLMSSYLGTDSNKQWAMTSVCLTITSQHLTVESLRQPKQQLFRHNLSMVSFASAGDINSLDLFCYVAKDVAGERLCHTFDCPGGIAQEVITTLGQAFQLGFQDFQRSKSGDKAVPSIPPDSNSVPSLITFDTAPTDPFQSRAPDYRASPKLPNPSDAPAVGLAFDNFANFDDNTWLLNEPLLTTTVDDTSEIPTAPPPPSRAKATIPSSDLNPFVATESSVQNVPEENPASHVQGLEPVGEPWYVGTMSRKEAERLLRYEGDFLVRASAQHPGQFVLSGLQDNKCRHLLLADPKGQVRTKERVFDSIQHLIDYHVQNGVPIRSGDSEIRLIFPVSAQNLFEF
ncbi:hypothetical protein CRM22_000439 [Opisthorchis felineus]|uniref:SH2 domain-containing protein n=2 Tax=Opisthorchis felineus TaxID=147828 RepID=A0A4V6RH92_OPIFE|nr:hypothetical protein CRM22_000439 [Opisthorchis felineus]